MQQIHLKIYFSSFGKKVVCLCFQSIKLYNELFYVNILSEAALSIWGPISRAIVGAYLL